VVLPAVKRSLVSDQVFRILSEQILGGRYEPGEKLPTQRALAADLGVNMASIREAVKRLEQLQLVEVRHGDAMRVRDWREEGGLDVVAHLLFRAGAADTETLAALLEARRLMLQEAARLAAERRSDAQAGRLRATAEAIASADGAEAVQILDFAFMTELVEASGNVVFRLILNNVRRLYFEHAESFAALASGPDLLIPLYARAAEAVSAGDTATAAATVGELAGEQERRLAEALG
jgi:GntR family transcriptional repressor for pyruvate dehydrogenase complex